MGSRAELYAGGEEAHQLTSPQPQPAALPTDVVLLEGEPQP